MPRLAWSFVFAALAAGVACGPKPGVEMSTEPPPASWEAAVRADRAERDEYFRSDPETPLHPADRATFAGLQFWEPTSALRFVGPVHTYPPSEPFSVITTNGRERPCVRYGWLSFRVDGRPQTLQVYRLLDAPSSGDEARDLFLPFTDRTTGVETYPAGRYVELEKLPDGRYVLDFNRAHNPFCAYGMPERFACPVTPAENRLAVRIEAGERGYRKRT